MAPSGGSWPRSTHGKQLLYVGPDGHLMIVDYQAKGDRFVAGNPRLWTEATFNAAGAFSPCDVAPDDKHVESIPRFVDSNDKDSVHVELLLNFFAELRRRIS
jgi:hypothetical protein